MVKLQLIGAAILLLGMLYIVRLIRKRRMELKYALPWLAVSCAALIVDCFPKLLSVLADLLGIATPVNALYLIAFLFSVCLLFALTVIVSRQSERMKQLVQAVAICEDRIKHLESEKEEWESIKAREEWDAQKGHDDRNEHSVCGT